MLLPTTIISLLYIALSLAHPLTLHLRSCDDGQETSGWDTLAKGHDAFIHKMDESQSGLLEDLTVNGQHPEFVVLACSDSRVGPDAIFDALPGTMFAERSVANMFNPEDTSAHTVVAYAVGHLHSRYIVVMGHYGCGGVAAAIASPPESPMSTYDEAIQAYVEPIRGLFASSEREEIIAFRATTNASEPIASPELHDPVFRALVEENVKNSVANVANKELHGFWDDDAPVFIYGLGYDIENGNIVDLGVSRGPPGMEIPPVPQFSKLK